MDTFKLNKNPLIIYTLAKTKNTFIYKIKFKKKKRKEEV